MLDCHPWVRPSLWWFHRGIWLPVEYGLELRVRVVLSDSLSVVDRIWRRGSVPSITIFGRLLTRDLLFHEIDENCVDCWQRLAWAENRATAGLMVTWWVCVSILLFLPRSSLWSIDKCRRCTYNQGRGSFGISSGWSTCVERRKREERKRSLHHSTGCSKGIITRISWIISASNRALSPCIARIVQNKASLYSIKVKHFHLEWCKNDLLFPTAERERRLRVCSGKYFIGTEKKNENIKKHTQTHGKRKQNSRCNAMPSIKSLLLVRLLMFIDTPIVIVSPSTSRRVRRWWRTVRIRMIDVTRIERDACSDWMHHMSIRFTYRLSEPSRKPFANGLLSIFSCVTWVEEWNHHGTELSLAIGHLHLYFGRPLPQWTVFQEMKRCLSVVSSTSAMNLDQMIDCWLRRYSNAAYTYA